ncbi:MAG: HEPN domain-containing protein [Candidatus Micrarchaeota archaeon]|nr:HEPN domain-containing protein [Candidatus Micrarchaeota archaeon]
MREGKIKRAEPDRLQAEESLKAAERDIAAAKEQKNPDWSFSIAYNSMLQAARALMFSDGYRSVGEGHHKTVVDYADAKLGAKYGKLVGIFDRMRAKRHMVVYEKVGVISDYEAEFAVKTAEEFLAKVKGKLK